MQGRKTPFEKEWIRLEKAEQKYLQKNADKQDSKLNGFLEEKVPEGMQNTLDAAFSKAFTLVFEKGTGIIEKTYNKGQMQLEFQVNEYAASVSEDRKTLKRFSKAAAHGKNLNLLLSGISGVGLGVLGIGLPDIVIFTGLVLKGLYELALRYGFRYDTDDERRFLLLLIRGALSYGDELKRLDGQVNAWIEKGGSDDANFAPGSKSDVMFGSESEVMPGSMTDAINAASGCMSKELLYMKFLQGIPLIGAVGGAYDYIYMKRIMKYAEIKYRRRFYMAQKQKEKR